MVKPARKTDVMIFRLEPVLKSLLAKAAKASGRTLSAEIEFHLRRGLALGRGSVVLPVVSMAIESLLALKHIKPGIWLEDAREFDRTVRFFNAALQMFRPPDRPLPPNAVLAPPEHQHLIETMDEKAARAALLALLAQIASADASVPRARQPRQEREFAAIKQSLADLIDRPALHELIPLAQQAVKDPEKLADEDTRELWRFIQRLASLCDLGVFDRVEEELTKG